MSYSFFPISFASRYEILLNSVQLSLQYNFNKQILRAHVFVEKCHTYSDSSFLTSLGRHRHAKVSFHHCASFFLFSESECRHHVNARHHVNVLFDDHYLIKTNNLERNSCNSSVFNEAFTKTECKMFNTYSQVFNNLGRVHSRFQSLIPTPKILIFRVW